MDIAITEDYIIPKISFGIIESCVLYFVEIISLMEVYEYLVNISIFPTYIKG